MTPLHHLGDFFRELLLRIPLGAARGLFLVTLILLLVWVLTRSREETTNPDPAGKAANLKPWAVLALLIQIVIYAVL
jgi:hypothetical protein